MDLQTREMLLPYKWDIFRRSVQGVKKNMGNKRTVFSGIVISVLLMIASAVMGGENISKYGIGNKNSTVAVFIFTDWVCPACRQSEEEMSRFYPKLMKISTLYFIDLPIHKETFNFIPYGIQYLLHNQGRYLQVRNALFNLSAKNQAPSQIDIENATKVKVGSITFGETDAGMKFHSRITKEIGVSTTPYLVVANLKKKQLVRFDGKNDIAPEKVFKVVEAMYESGRK